VDGYHEIEHEYGQSLAAFLRGPSHSPSTLKTLHITNGIFLDNTMLAILQGLSNLKHLVLDGSDLTSDPDLFANLSSKDLAARARVSGAPSHAHQSVQAVWSGGLR
jgi:hypothetical protein